MFWLINKWARQPVFSVGRNFRSDQSVPPHGENMVSKHLASVVLTGTLGIGPSACAQTSYPSQPIHLIAPFGSGGSTDILARLFAQKIGEQVGQPIVVQNRPGANGNIGSALVAKAAPNGYTILYNNGDIVPNMFLYSNLSFDVLRDFAPVSTTNSAPMLLVIPQSSPARTFKEFLAHLRANPGKTNYASVGVGSITHLIPLLMLNMNNLESEHVPYSGGVQGIYADLMTGRTQYYFSSIAAALPFIKSGQFRPLAVSSLNRNRALPDVPTMNESGMNGFEATSWQGLLAPAKTPVGIVNVLNGAVRKVLDDLDTQRQLDKLGRDPFRLTPQEYETYLKQEHARWGKIIREGNIKAE